MSVSYVRNLVRQWCNEAAASEGVPFYDTINRNVKPAGPVWFTVEFVAEATEGTFCTPDLRENGFVDLVVIARPGIGDSAALGALESLVPTLMAKADPNGQLTLDSYDPVQEDSAGTADSDYRMSVVLNYSFGRV